MMARVRKKLLYPITGLLVTAAAFGCYLYTYTHKQQLVKQVAQPALAGSQCTDPAESAANAASELSEPAEEIFFAGCAGYF